MNRKKLAEKIAKRFRLSISLSERILEDTFGIIAQEMVNGNKVSIVHFGSFFKKSRHARKGVDPRKPENIIDVPECNVAKFKANPTLKKTINK